MHLITFRIATRHFDSYKQSKLMVKKTGSSTRKSLNKSEYTALRRLRGTQRTGRYMAVKSS